jgi:hypothetical protein
MKLSYTSSITQNIKNQNNSGNQQQKMYHPATDINDETYKPQYCDEQNNEPKHDCAP